MRPTFRVAGAVVLGAVLYLYGATSEVVWLFLLAYWSWTFAVAMLVYATWNRNGVEASVRLTGIEVAEGSPVSELPEAVLRTAPLPGPLFEGDRATVACVLAAPRGVRGPARAAAWVAGQVLRVGVGVVPREGVRVERGGVELRRGVLGVDRIEVETSDPLGFFTARQPGHAGELALVFPRLTALSPDPRQRELEASAPAPRAGAGSELFGVREYRPGDPLRRIHWRLSARRAGLVVREFEPPGLRTLLVVLDSQPAPEAADQAARIAASEAWDCVRAGGRAALWAPGLQPTGAERELWPLLEWLARWPALPSQSDDAPWAGEVVAVTTTGEAVTTLDGLGRGATARGWAVGEVALATDLPLRSAGLEWPL
ncbi:MAG TPA: DUF58 domain-containing protein [Candidatus Dormibacteraeota bacterium]